MVALKAFEVVTVPVVVGVQPLRGIVGKSISAVLHTPSPVGVGPTVPVVICASFSVVGGGPHQHDTIVFGVNETVLVRVSVGLVDAWGECVVKSVVAPRIPALHLEQNFA